jgi:hypothetical protein
MMMSLAMFDLIYLICSIWMFLYSNSFMFRMMMSLAVFDLIYLLCSLWMFSVPLLWPAISSTRLTEEYFLIPAK